MRSDATSLWLSWRRQRDARAFEALVSPELPHALGFARRLGCAVADAEDALQDALTRLATTQDDAPVAVGVRAWLCREIRVRTRSRWRSDRRRRARESAAAVPDTHDGRVADVDVREDLERALASLEPEERAAVELRYLHDLDYREIAFVLGGSEGASRQRVHKALARLRARHGWEVATHVAALPLPVLTDASRWVSPALAEASAVPAAIGGVTMMATTTQKIAVTAALAASLGVGGTLLTQQSRDSAGSNAEALAATAAHSTEVATRDAEIERLTALLAEAQKRRVPRPRVDPAALDRGARTTPAETERLQKVPVVSATETTAAPKRPPVPVAIDLAAAMKQAKVWQAALRQVGDAGKRDVAWADVRSALTGADLVKLVAALQTVAFTRDVKLERTGLRDLVVRSVHRPEKSVRLPAWQALINTGIEPQDIEVLRGQVLSAPRKDRQDFMLRLNWAAKAVIEGPNADVALELFTDNERRKETVYALHGAKMSDAVMAKVLEYARTDAEAAQHAQHFVLRTLRDKNRDVVTFLLDRAEQGDFSALEALFWGVRAEDAEFAGERLRKLFEARSEQYVRSQILQSIGRIRDESSRDWLRQIGDDAALDPAVSAAARGAIKFLDRPQR